METVKPSPRALWHGNTISFLKTQVCREDAQTIIKEINLVVEGKSIQYDSVYGQQWHNLCRELGLDNPNRIKIWVCHQRGGVRVVFAKDLTSDKTFILHIDFRDNDPYKDGG